MFQPLDRLGRADQTARAAPAYIHFAGLVDLPHRRRAAGRANLGHDPGGPLPRLHDAQHLRDHIARALDLDHVPRLDAEARDLVLVVQGGVGDHHAAHRHRLEPCHRGERARPADLDINAEQGCRRLLGRELVRDRPARRPADKAQPLLPVEPVDLVDDPVDVIGEPRALRLDLPVVGKDVLDRQDTDHQRIGDEAPFGELPDCTGLCI